ncbi:VOC family protein [Telmatobacter sp. DSM 110680]|uniref:Bleomycin resistance protein n=1 Tax=Telmatobacter sp. DSM 110680 TaxID=3036704 RepID=A0AAU7DJV1_9BACT
MPRLERIAPELPSANLDSAISYYEKKLGFEVALRFPGNEYAIVERDGVAIHLFVAGSLKPDSIGIHIFTSGLDQFFREFETSGAIISQKIERKPWGNREFRVRDEFGNELKFTEPIEEDAA